MIQRLGVQIPAEVEEFFNSKKTLVQTANKFQLGNDSIVSSYCYFLSSAPDFPILNAVMLCIYGQLNVHECSNVMYLWAIKCTID